MLTILNFNEYDVSQSLIFQDVKNLKIDFKEDVMNFAFGFQWERKVIDMIDNEFVTINYIY